MQQVVSIESERSQTQKANTACFLSLCTDDTKIVYIHTRDLRGGREKGEFTRWGKGSVQSKNMTHLQEVVFMKPIIVLNGHEQNKEVSNQSEHKCLNERQLFKQFVLSTLVCFQRELLAAAVSSPPAWELCVQLGNTELQQILNSPCAHSVSSSLF